MNGDDISNWRAPIAATLEMARSMTAQNHYQGEWPRVLCVCSAGLLRSPTLAWVLSNPPYSCNTRAAGSHLEFGLVVVDQVLLNWAQVVVFANHENYERTVIDRKLALPGKVFVLNLPDRFAYRDQKLVDMIHAELAGAGFTKREGVCRPGDAVDALITKFSNRILELDGADMEQQEIPLILTEFVRELKKL